MRRTLLPALAVLLAASSCQSSPALPAPPAAPGPPAIPDAQSVVDAPLFLGQSTFAAPLTKQTDFAPALATTRADGGNSGVADGPAPLGRAPVTGSAALPIVPPLLWGSSGLVAGCRIELVPGLTRSCLATVDTSTLTVSARWLPPGQDLNLASAVLDSSQRVIVTTRQRHVFVVARPDSDTSFTVIRDIDLNSHLSLGQGLLGAVFDANGNLWFVSGGTPPSGSPAATTTTVGFVTSDDQVVATTLANQRVETGLAVDQGNVFLATAPAGPADLAGARGQIYDLSAVSGQVQTLWRDSYDAGSGVEAGGTTRGTGGPVILLGSQYQAVTDNADGQSHLLVWQRGSLPAASGATSTSTTAPLPTASSTTAPLTTTTGPLPTASSTTGPLTTTTAVAPSTSASGPTTKTTTSTASGTGSTNTAGGVADARLVCTVALFSPGASAVNTAAIGYSSSDTNSVVVANGYHAPPPLADPSDEGPANNINQMAAGLTRVDVLADGSGCRTVWSDPLRLKTAPILSSTSGLLYGYTQDEARAATGSYIWYFVAVDYQTGRVVWRQRAGAGASKNDNRLPTFIGANGVLYQAVPSGLEWMRDVAQQP